MVDLTSHFPILSGGRDDFAMLNRNASAANLIQIRSATFSPGRAASGGALAPEPPRTTRSQPEPIRIFSKKKLAHIFLEKKLALCANVQHSSHCENLMTTMDAAQEWRNCTVAEQRVIKCKYCVSHNKMNSIIRSSGTIFFPLLYVNSRIGFN